LKFLCLTTQRSWALWLYPFIQ